MKWYHRRDNNDFYKDARVLSFGGILFSIFTASPPFGLSKKESVSTSFSVI